ncbi:cellulose biosynthesis protein BcsQ [Noviherbaspirillum galbum]|uniref:Cellulose synthase operon protein YhjQ n=1 Tax=Noviherbaspirillum galbum TaxID=2709383 RepID=A0A6B3SGQ3_9BURK|nr:cellulose biosynthesis protein BcsQ [Noviherbaspirillum galbum]NEX60031.1 cellulose synthase operon protein YhjQ [Noviherbaspirillum galbum]
MSVIGIVSMKGGVGKTSITANLASALASRLGHGRVSVVDLDPQNALHWHFGIEEGTRDGVCEATVRGADWRGVACESDYDVTCLPYGAGAEEDRLAFEAHLARRATYVGDQIRRAGLDDNAVVLIDTPPGPSVYLKQVFACADILLIVLLADAGSYATIPAMEAWLEEMDEFRRGMPSVYVLNQVDTSEPLSRDVTNLLRQHLGKRLAQVSVHADEAVGEALAFQQPVMAYDPHGQASHDVARLANWLVDILNR